jgi:hypothetical protein
MSMSDRIADDKDVKTVLEAHGVLPEGPMFDDVMKVVSLYSDRIQELLSKFSDPVSKKKALLAILEEGLMQEGFIPNTHERKFELPVEKTD